MDYYKKKQLLALVDENDKITGKLDKWEAHKKGLLHRGFTVCLYYKDQIILQHRKHPVFDGVYDLTFSSHPVYKNDTIQDNLDAVYESLLREWNIKKEDLLYEPIQKGPFYYKAKDPRSDYTEHEMCSLYISEIVTLPSPNLDFAYGFSFVPKDKIIKNELPIITSFAPWVPKLLEVL